MTRQQQEEASAWLWALGKSLGWDEAISAAKMTGGKDE